MNILLILVSFATTIIAALGANNDNNEQKVQQFRSKQSDVLIVSNFLPLELAQQWQSQMKQIWNNTEKMLLQNNNDETNVCTNNDAMEKEEEGSCVNKEQDDTFYYATNNNQGGTTTSLSVNAKFRSLSNIHERNKTAQTMYEANQFSYAKWELHPTHSLVHEIDEYMSSETTRTRVQEIIQAHTQNRHEHLAFSSELSDLFVTLYSTGDFLSQHNDGVAGTWAFVVNLMEGNGEWDVEQYGGGLRFQCEDRNVWCQTLAPSFNTATLIQTRVVAGDSFPRPGPMHEVLRVKHAAQRDGFYRFGFTGWYTSVDDHWDEHSKREREKMRARD